MPRRTTRSIPPRNRSAAERRHQDARWRARRLRVLARAVERPRWMLRIPPDLADGHGLPAGGRGEHLIVRLAWAQGRDRQAWLASPERRLIPLDRHLWRALNRLDQELEMPRRIHDCWISERPCPWCVNRGEGDRRRRLGRELRELVGGAWRDQADETAEAQARSS